MTRYTLILSSVFLFGAALSAHAEENEIKEKDDKTIVAVVIENDSFSDTDQHYTNGFRAGFSPPAKKTPQWMRNMGERSGIFSKGSDFRAIYTIGQNMYTPEELSLSEPDPNDRPYAGWLYTSVGLAGYTSESHEVLEVSLGIVGPAAMAEPAQKFVHDLIGADEPNGWDFQLENEPAITLTYQKSWTAYKFESLGLEGSLAPHIGGSVGNVFAYANSGITARIGKGLRNDTGPPRIQPAILSSGLMTERNYAWFVFAAYEGRLIARNIFLDGNTFKNGPSVDKKNFVQDMQIGAVIQRGEWKLSYTHVFRSDEFYGQKETTTFGAFGIARAF